MSLDARGFLWAATQDGAAYYDGRLWTAVPLPERAIEDGFIRCVLGASDGSVWLGTRSNGLYRYDNGRWTWFRREFVGSGHSRVNALLETLSPEGQPVLWVATHSGGIARFQHGVWRWFTRAEGLPSNQLWGLGATTEPGGGVTVWAGTSKGLVRLPSGAARFERGAGFPRASVNSFLAIPEPDSGREVLWAGTYGSGLYRFENGTWTHLTRHDGLGSNFLTSLATSRDPEGRLTIWAGTDGGGVARISGGKIRVFGLADGLPSNAAYSLLTTTEAQGARAVWIGTRNGGLLRLMEGKWQRVWPGPAGRVVPVLSVAETRSRRGCSEYWIGTDGLGLFHHVGGTWSDVPQLRGRTIQCLLAGGDGTVWAGTRTAGLAEIHRGRVRFHSKKSSFLDCDMIQALAETPGGDGGATLWIGTRRGLYTMRHGKAGPLQRVDEAVEQSVAVLLPAGTGDGDPILWAGVGGRLARRASGRWAVFPPSSGLYNAPVQCLMLQETGSGRRLWVGTDGGGITVLDVSGAPRTLFTFGTTVSGSLSNDVVYWIGEDHRGRIYVLTNRGVSRLTPRVKMPEAASDYDLTVFTAEDGLPSNQGSRGAGLFDRSGRILVGTAGGAALLDPESVLPDRTAKRLLLDVYREGAKPVKLEPGCRLAYNDKHIVFRATLLSLFRGWDTRYRTELAGFDAEPSEWHVLGTQEYRNLPHGFYTFRVWGRDYAGNVSGPVEFPFEIEPAPWQTWWARLLMLLGLAALIWLAFGLRTRAIRDRESRLASLVEDRTRELAEANARLEELAREDPLTGLANRRAFDQALEAEWRRALRAGQALGLIIVDIDGFKAWNDSHGHPAGDDYLRELAKILTGVTARASDLAARIGGDEFAVLLPGSPVEGGVVLAEEIRAQAEKIRKHWAVARGGGCPTVSCGVAAALPTMSVHQELLELADRCLYRAKEHGGNRVVSSRELETDWPL
ncbi:MAG: diguanylate cyclase [Acidobacteria bacterium]|nr:diguanylate cyclase [Acidobacteriota bacterium]